MKREAQEEATDGSGLGEGNHDDSYFNATQLFRATKALGNMYAELANTSERTDAASAAQPASRFGLSLQCAQMAPPHKQLSQIIMAMMCWLDILDLFDEWFYVPAFSKQRLPLGLQELMRLSWACRGLAQRQLLEDIPDW